MPPVPLRAPPGSQAPQAPQERKALSAWWGQLVSLVRLALPGLLEQPDLPVRTALWVPPVQLVLSEPLASLARPAPPGQMVLWEPGTPSAPRNSLPTYTLSVRNHWVSGGQSAEERSYVPVILSEQAPF